MSFGPDVDLNFFRHILSSYQQKVFFQYTSIETKYADYSRFDKFDEYQFKKPLYLLKLKYKTETREITEQEKDLNELGPCKSGSFLKDCCGEDGLSL